jgi:hypothetical protein
MKFQSFSVALLSTSAAFAAVVKRDSGFPSGQPIDAKGKGGPILGMLRKRTPRDVRADRLKAVPTTRSTSITPPISASKAPTLALYRI